MEFGVNGPSGLHVASHASLITMQAMDIKQEHVNVTTLHRHVVELSVTVAMLQLLKREIVHHLHCAAMHMVRQAS